MIAILAFLLLTLSIGLFVRQYNALTRLLLITVIIVMLLLLYLT